MSGINEIKDDAIVIIKERIAGPFGYILFSFIAYNWSWIYLLFFSKKTAEEKISDLVINFDKISGFGWPVLAGCLLAISTPFIRVVMVYITAIARKLEDMKNHQIKNFLDDYVEQTNLSLVKKRQEITERNSKIKELELQKDKLEHEVKNERDALEKIREDDKKLFEERDKAKGEVYSLEKMISEYRISNHSFLELRESLSSKSSEYSQLKRQLITFREETEKVISYFPEDRSIYVTPSTDDLNSFRQIVESIHTKIKNIDNGYFSELVFSFSQNYNQVEISSLKHINWGSVIKLLTDNDIPFKGIDPNTASDSVILYFERELQHDERKKIASLIKQFLDNN
ncbi:hypothetical protein AB4M04_05770 [Serratia quinivorans]|uniref:Uncharacterized protein n=1 Tax=Serratia quinivorans TaxID=137545 RepID=A0ABV3UIE8_9GAMM